MFLRSTLLLFIISVTTSKTKEEENSNITIKEIKNISDSEITLTLTKESIFQIIKISSFSECKKFLELLTAIRPLNKDFISEVAKSISKKYPNKNKNIPNWYESYKEEEKKTKNKDTGMNSPNIHSQIDIIKNLENFYNNQQKAIQINHYIGGIIIGICTLSTFFCFIVMLYLYHSNKPLCKLTANESQVTNN